jgi:hypothetical protein
MRGANWIFLLILALLLACIGCQGKHVEGGRITVRNDVLDKEYNSFQVDNLLTNKGQVSYRAELKPGEEIVLPFKNITGLRFKRRYPDHFKVYEVTCPANFNQAVTMKLIDVHTNRLQAGCELRRRGVMSIGGLVKWE